MGNAEWACKGLRPRVLGVILFFQGKAQTQHQAISFRIRKSAFRIRLIPHSAFRIPQSKGEDTS